MCRSMLHDLERLGTAVSFNHIISTDGGRSAIFHSSPPKLIQINALKYTSNVPDQRVTPLSQKYREAKTLKAVINKTKEIPLISLPRPMRREAESKCGSRTCYLQL
jgi:hypothetical protein